MTRRQPTPTKRASLVVIAGKSEELMEIGNIEFMMAPITMREYIDYEILRKSNPDERSQAEWLAGHLRKRVAQPTKAGNDPAGITTDWVLDNVPMVLMGTFRYILLNGKLPTADDGGDNDDPK